MDDWELAESVRYRINGDDLLVDVNRGWQRFAMENGAAHLVSNLVLGRSLWDFVSDAETRCIYEAILQTVRGNKRNISLDLRCDAPARRRFIRLDIAALSRRRVQFVGRVSKIERRDAVALLEPDFDRSTESLMICGWCKSIVLPGGRCLEIEEAVRQLGLFHSHVLPRLNHGVCPSCRAAAMKSLGDDVVVPL